jgi:feruloyl esterase
MNAEALVNFGGAQLKKTHDVAIQLVLRRYGAGPSRTYFFGNSQAGHEGFIVIQRWPQDYDGVVSIHPVYDFTALQIDGNALARALYNSKGAWLNPAKLKLLQDSVMKACDGLDGAEDGVISNIASANRHSAFIPAARREDPRFAALRAQIKRLMRFIRASLLFLLCSQKTSFAPWPILEGGIGLASLRSAVKAILRSR